MIPRDCSDELTMSELRIKAASEFFGPSCKAGIWDEDQTRDKKLSKFPLRIILSSLVLSLLEINRKSVFKVV